MPLIRQDIEPTAEEKYRGDLEERIKVIRAKTWRELTAEDKDLLDEYMAFRQGLVAAPK